MVSFDHLTSELSADPVVANRNELMSLFLLALALFVNLGPWWQHAIIFPSHDPQVASAKVTCRCCCHKPIDLGHQENADGGSVQAPPCSCPICKFFDQYQVAIEKQSFEVSVSIDIESRCFVLAAAPSVVLSHSARGPPSRS